MWWNSVDLAYFVGFVAEYRLPVDKHFAPIVAGKSKDSLRMLCVASLDGC